MEGLKDFVLELDEEYTSLSNFYDLLQSEKGKLSKCDKTNLVESAFSLMLLEKADKFVLVGMEHITTQRHVLQWYTTTLEEQKKIDWRDLTESFWKEYKRLKEIFMIVRRTEARIMSTDKLSMQDQIKDWLAIKDVYGELINQTKKLSNSLKTMAADDGCTF